MKKLVLIAEDDQAIVEVMNIILTEAGYETAVIAEGNGVISAVKERKPDLLLLDIWLSGEDGGELAKKLKADEVTRDVSVVMISANTETEQIAKDSGADGFLRKPFDIDEFLATVKRYASS